MSDVWIKFYGIIVEASADDITLSGSNGEVVFKIKSGDYRIDPVDGRAEIRVGTKANFIKLPSSCKIKRKDDKFWGM